VSMRKSWTDGRQPSRTGGKQEVSEDMTMAEER